MSEESLRHWIHQAEVEGGQREGLTEAEREELRQKRLSAVEHRERDKCGDKEGEARRPVAWVPRPEPGVGRLGHDSSIAN